MDALSVSIASFVDDIQPVRSELARFAHHIARRATTDDKFRGQLQELTDRMDVILRISPDAETVQRTMGPRWGAPELPGLSGAMSTVVCASSLRAKNVLRAFTGAEQLDNELTRALANLDRLGVQSAEYLSQLVIEVNARALSDPGLGEALCAEGSVLEACAADFEAASKSLAPLLEGPLGRLLASPPNTAQKGKDWRWGLIVLCIILIILIIIFAP